MRLLTTAAFSILFVLGSNAQSKSDTEEVLMEPLFPGFDHIEDYEQRRTEATTALLQYIYKNLNYPETAKKDGIYGRVFIQFMVTSLGEIKDVTIKKDIGGGCGEAAAQVIESMNSLDNTWTPAMVNGQPVDKLFTVPVVFRLENPVKSQTDSSLSIEGHQNIEIEPFDKEYLEGNNIYTDVDIMPMFPGCNHIQNIDDRRKCSEEKILKYVVKNLKYPKAARENDIEGQVIVQFVVNKEGRIEDIKIAKDIGEGCGQALVDMVNSMNKMKKPWSPGIRDGQPVKVLFTMPVHFRTESKLRVTKHY